MPQFEVQVIAHAWVNRRITLEGSDAETAAQQAIALAKAWPGSWEIAGAREYIQVLMDPQGLTDFTTDEITVEE